MLSIAIWKSADGTEWNPWCNKYDFGDATPTSFDDVKNMAHELMKFEGGLHRADTKFITGAVWIGSDAQNAGENGTYYTIDPEGLGHDFARPMTGIPKWRWALGVRMEMPYGPSFHKYYHNCITDDDIINSREDGIVLKKRDEFETWVDNSWHTQQVTLWHNLVVMKAGGLLGLTGGPTKVTKLYVPFASDLHAQTRWRRRLSANGKGKFLGYQACLTRCARCLLANKEMIDYDIDYVPEKYYQETTDCLHYLSATGESFKDFLEDADGDENNGKNPPITRFGVSIEAVKKPFGVVKAWVDNAMADFQQVHHPNPGPDGLNYIKSSDLKEWNDVLKDYTNQCSSGWWFDWYNPLAYESNKDNWMDPSTPDVVELDF